MTALNIELLKEQVATKADLAELKAELIKWNIGTMTAMTGIFTAIVKLT
jgi:hypothetical protein